MRKHVANAVPHIQEPGSPHSDTNTLTPGTSKSKLRSLFHWRKPSSGSLRPNTQSGLESNDHVPSSVESTSRPGLNPRSRSDDPNSSTLERPLSADNKLSRKRDRLVIDPPPLAQAYRQALLHAQLETPLSFTEKPNSHRNSHISKDQLSGESSEDRVEVKRSHKRTDSGESSCSTHGKVFFLVPGPYVLQYNGDSNGDALPEKILVLDRDSLAFACDAVPGRPWVLQISKPQTPTTKTQGQTLRPSWSRLTLRQPEDRRTVNTLLLIYTDSEELYTWLFAIRKEIENLGGLEYRPDAGDDQTWRENLTRTFASSSEAGPDSRKSSTAQTASTLASPDSFNKVGRLGPHSRTRSQSNQSCASSKKTSSSLDRLRDSVTSDGYTSTLATSCADGSAPSTSPSCEAFPSIKSVTDHVNGDLSLRIYSKNSSVPSNPSKSPPLRSLMERRKLSVNSLRLDGADGAKDRARKALPDLPSTISASPIETPPPLTSPPAANVADAKHHSSISTQQSQLNDSSDMKEVKDRQGGKVRKHSPGKASIAESSTSIPKAKYSLFPVCPPAEIKDEPLASPTALVQPASLPGRPSQIEVQPRKSVGGGRPAGGEGGGTKHRKSRSRTVTLELRQHRVSALLGAGDLDQPQRSPAVTDEMIMMNFGITRDNPPASPIPEIRVPGLSDLKIDLEFLKAPYRAPSKPRSPLSDSRRASSIRSSSGSRTEMPTTLAKTPVGPPPAGPLPAVPMSNGRESWSNRSSQQSQKSQGKKHDRTQSSGATEQTSQLYDVHSTAKHANLDQRIDRRTVSTSISATSIPNSVSPGQPGNGGKPRSRSGSRGRRRSTKKA